MTEEELRNGDWGKMHDFLMKQRSRRKKMLAFCACCRVTWEHVTFSGNRKAIEASELFADGEIDLEALRKRWQRMRFEPVVYTSWFLPAAGPADRPNAYLRLAPRDAADLEALEAFEQWRTAKIEAEWNAAWVVCGLDVFGHVLTGARLSPKWRTSDAVSIAKQMYESRDFGAMPILADALQDAGCDNEDVLDHCRDASVTHVRGCWVVDLVLRKK